MYSKVTNLNSSADNKIHHLNIQQKEVNSKIAKSSLSFFFFFVLFCFFFSFYSELLYYKCGNM